MSRKTKTEELERYIEIDGHIVTVRSCIACPCNKHHIDFDDTVDEDDEDYIQSWDTCVHPLDRDIDWDYHGNFPKECPLRTRRKEQ